MLIATIGVVVMASVVNAASFCNGAGYDLTTLSTQGDIGGSDNSYKYTLTPCGVAQDPKCSALQGSFCQFDTSTPPGYKHMLAVWDGSGTWATCTDPFCGTGGGVQVSFANGDICSGNPRTVTIMIACNAQTTGKLQYTVSAQGLCGYLIKATHQAGCKGNPPPPGPTPGVNPSGGLSGGWIFIIIFLCTTFTYVVVGCIYKRQKMGTAGMESCPNVDFWRDFPSLVADGFKFTFTKLRACCGKGDGTYETVK